MIVLGNCFFIHFLFPLVWFRVPGVSIQRSGVISRAGLRARLTWAGSALYPIFLKLFIYNLQSFSRLFIT